MTDTRSGKPLVGFDLWIVFEHNRVQPGRVSPDHFRKRMMDNLVSGSAG